MSIDWTEIYNNYKGRWVALGMMSRPYYLHPVTSNVGGWNHAIEAGFVPNFKPAFGIVGQVGFFSLFVVKFDYQKEEVEIRRKD